MNPQLLLENIRSVLMRLEETIIFSLIERAQFRYNQVIYQPGQWPQATGHESIMGFLLQATEKNHALLRRYTSPDEHPFYTDLPEPVLPQLRFDENPLYANTINLNHQIRHVYERRIVPYICPPGDDSQYGSSAVCDVHCLQAISKRIHYGKFVAESKYRESPEVFQRPLQERNQEVLLRLITDEQTEHQILRRISRKALAYGRDPEDAEPGKTEKEKMKLEPEKAVRVYHDWIIPLTKEVEILYLLARPCRSHKEITPDHPD